MIHQKIKLLNLCLFRIVALVYFVLLPLTLYAQDYSDANLFSYQCEEGGILFFYQGNPVIWTSFDQAREKLETAIGIYQNQHIVSLNGISLWALRSNEFQIHVADNSEGTKLVLSSTICGTLVAIASSSQSTQTITVNDALVFVESGANGQAVAYVEITADGSVITYAEVKGEAKAFAMGHSVQIAGDIQIHVVQSGENLFRIALRYNTSVAAIAAANNISDPSLIYVGQTLTIPS